MEPNDSYEWTIGDVEKATRGMIETFAHRGWDVDVRVTYTRTSVQGERGWVAQCVVHSTRAWAPNAPYVYAEVMEASLADALLHLASAAEDEYVASDVADEEVYGV